jgi:hypothetical protein
MTSSCNKARAFTDKSIRMPGFSRVYPHFHASKKNRGSEEKMLQGAQQLSDALQARELPRITAIGGRHQHVTAYFDQVTL